MILTINDDLLVEEVQECFSKCFPDLKIEFYSKPGTYEHSVSDHDQAKPKARIGKIRNKHTSDSLEIKPSDTAGKIENSFKSLLGLDVQIFRVETKNWTQITTAGSCSLKVQQEPARPKVFVYPKSIKQMNEYRFYL